MSNVFQKLELQAFRAGINPRTDESREWFRRKAQQLTNINREALMKEDGIKSRSNTVTGKMYMFFYDPKTKQT